MEGFCLFEIKTSSISKVKSELGRSTIQVSYDGIIYNSRAIDTDVAKSIFEWY